MELAAAAIRGGDTAIPSFRSSTVEDCKHSPKLNRHMSLASVFYNGGVDHDHTFETLLADGSHVMYLSSSSSEPLFYDSCRGFVEAHSALIVSCASDRSSRVCHWIDVQTTDSVDFQLLGRLLALRELTMEDCLDFDVTEKFETFPIENDACSSILVRPLQHDADDVEHCVPVHFILMNRIVVTIHAEPIPGLCTVLIRFRFKGFDKPFDILFSILDVFVDEVIPLIDAILCECECIEKLVFALPESEQSDLLLRINNSRKKLVVLRRLLTGKQKIVSQLSRAKWTAIGLTQQDDNLVDSRSHEHLESTINLHALETSDYDYSMSSKESSDSARLLLRGLSEHINSCLHKIERSCEMLTQANSNYLSRMSISVSRSSQMTNNWMKRMGIVATGMPLLKIVTSAFGMNVHVPWQDVESTDPVFGILAVTSVVAFTLTVVCCSVLG
eukprot:ANDGO_07278.mRNA.1 Putative metal ion transporter C17A12.14